MALNGNGEGFGHFLLLLPLKIGGGPVGRWGLLGLLWQWVGFKRDEVEERWVCQRQRLAVNGKCWQPLASVAGDVVVDRWW